MKDKKFIISETPMSNLKTYQFTGIYGETDLKSLSPWVQPDGGWPNWSPAFSDVTEESYNANPKAYELRVQIYNWAYIEKLKLEGKYLQPYVINITLQHNPSFDNSTTFGTNEEVQELAYSNVVKGVMNLLSPLPKTGTPLESYRMIFLDSSVQMGEPLPPEKMVHTRDFNKENL